MTDRQRANARALREQEAEADATRGVQEVLRRINVRAGRVRHRYLLDDASGTALYAGVAPDAGGPALGYAERGGHLYVRDTDGRLYLAALPTCDHCGVACERDGVADGARRFCDEGCRDEWRWAQT